MNVQWELKAWIDEPTSFTLYESLAVATYWLVSLAEVRCATFVSISGE